MSKISVREGSEREGSALFSKGLKSNIGVSGIFLLGLILSILALLNLLVSDDLLFIQALETLVMLIPAISLFYIAYKTSKSDFDSESTFEILTWCIVLASLSAASAFLMMLLFRQMRNFDLYFINGAAVAAGSTVGGIIGFYAVKNQRKTQKLKEEHERAKHLNQKLKVIHRLLRHDLRNSATVVLGNTELIIEESGNLNGSSDEIEKKARAIKEKTRKLAELSQKVKQVEQTLENQETIDKPIEIIDVLEHKVNEMELEHPEVEIERDLPESKWVYATSLIDSAINNAIENAIEHNDKQKPRIRVSVSDKNEHVEIKIADNGPGIPEDELRVLKNGNETDLQHTSGLGLWIINWIVDESGGEVEFSANKPEGTVVTIRLPRSEPRSEKELMS